MPRGAKTVDPTIRSATRADLAAVERLLTSNALPTAGVAEALPNFVVAEHEGRIVGVAGLEPRSGRFALLRSAAVDDIFRGQGLGRTLVRRLIADAERSGVHALYLLTTTAEKWFPNFGFMATSRADVPVEVRESVEFTESCPASATVMVLELKDTR